MSATESFIKHYCYCKNVLFPLRVAFLCETSLLIKIYKNEKSNETPKIYNFELKLIWNASKFKYSPKTKSVFSDD